MQQQQLQQSSPAPPKTEAPPKQVALAMDRLNHAGRLIADIRLGADRLLEAMFMAGENQQSNKPFKLIVQEESSMRQYLHDLRTVGKQLEDSGVLNESLRSRSNSWGLHMPLVCPDGAVVAYAWKRQLAGQAGASAVDRTRLALKAFTDQKKRFFPHLDDDNETGSPLKKHCDKQTSTGSEEEEPSELATVSDILLCLEKEVHDVKSFTYPRLKWLKRASLLPMSSSEPFMDPSKEHSFHNSNKLGHTTMKDNAAEKISVIELLFPSIFRAVLSLHPAGSVYPDSVAFFSPDEGGSYLHARGFSVHRVFRHITEHAAIALQYFTGISTETALHSLLLWICSYRTLFTKVCSKCGRLLSMDKQSALMLPPVQRPYRDFPVGKFTSSEQSSATNHYQIIDSIEAYHIGCFPEEI